MLEMGLLQLFELSMLSQSQEKFVPLGLLFKSKLANMEFGALPWLLIMVLNPNNGRATQACF